MRFLLSLVLLCGCIPGYYWEPNVGVSYGESHPGEFESQWATVGLAFKKEPVFHVEPAPVTVVTAGTPTNVTVNQEPAAESEELAGIEVPESWAEILFRLGWPQITFLSLVILIYAFLVWKGKAPFPGFKGKK